MSANVEPSSDFRERSDTTAWCTIPKRYVQALLASFALFIVFWMRSSFLFAFLHTIYSHRDESQISWTSTNTYLVDSALTWGFLVAQIPGALLSIKFCSHSVLPASVMVITAFHCILPFLLNTNVPLLIVVRILQGIAEGPIYPACIGIWKSWAPPSERTTLFSIVLCGSFFGTVVGEQLNSVLTNNFGAKSCFYISSISGLIWCVVWVTQTYESPSNNPYISHHELTYLEENVDLDNRLEVTVRSVPWKSILMSPPVWVICLANFCYSFSISPYLYSEIHFTYNEDITLLEILLPYIIFGVIVSVSGFFADFLVNKGHLSRNIVRKLYCSGAFTLHGVAFLIIRYYHNNDAAVICSSFSRAILGLSIVGFLVNCLDLSPCYASLVMAFCQIFGTLSDIIVSVVFNSKIMDVVTFHSVLDAVISVNFLVALIYAFFGSSNLQRWGKPETSCTEVAGDESARSTYYSYPDDEDCVELILNGHQSSKASAVQEKEKY